MRLVLSGGFVAVAFFGLYSVASAHATPQAYEPNASAIVEEFPTEVQIQFSERVEPRASSIVVFAPDGRVVQTADAVINPGNGYFYRVPLQSHGTGTYTVSWHVMSGEDGHFSQGTYSFSYKSASNLPPEATAAVAQISSHSGHSEAETIWVELMGQACVFGGLVILWFVWKPMRATHDKHEVATIEKSLIHFLATGAALIVLGGGLYIVERIRALSLVKSISFSEGYTIFIHTFAGEYTSYRVIAGILLFFVIFLFHRRVVRGMVNFASIGSVALALFIAFDRALVSHAYASHLLPRFSVVVNFFHLVSKDAWIGSVLALIVLVSTVKNARFVEAAAARFSQVAPVTLALGGVTGCYIIWLHLKGFSQLFGSQWGLTLFILSLVAFCFLGARIYQQCVVRKRRPFGVELFESVLLLEGVCGVLILVITAQLIITTPPVQQVVQFQKTFTNEGVTATLTQSSTSTNVFLLSFLKPRQSPEFSAVYATISNSQKSIEQLGVPLLKKSPTLYEFPKNIFSPSGQWRLNVSVQRAHTYDINGTFDILYPEEVQLKRADDIPRTFGWFELSIILAAVMIAVVSMWMFTKSRSSQSYPH